MTHSVRHAERDRQLTFDGCYDAIVSIEMIEAVGHAYLPTYFAACSRLLAEDGAIPETYQLQETTSREYRVRTEQNVIDFYHETRPISMAIVIDTSGSMKDKIREVHKAAGAFVERQSSSRA